MIDWLTAYGLFAVTAMLVFYALEDRSRWFVLGFAAACLLGSLYGFLQGAWPFGVVEAIWAVVAFRRWRTTKAPTSVHVKERSIAAQPPQGIGGTDPKAGTAS